MTSRQQAPALPTTETLHALYPFDEAAMLRRDFARQRVGSILTGQEDGFVAYIGGCAMTEDTATIRRQGEANRHITDTEEGLYVVDREPWWKPRNNPDRAWAGLETGPSDNSGRNREAYAEMAYRTVWIEATLGAGIAGEIGQSYHPERYGHLLITGWFGARLDNKNDLRGLAARMHPELPLAVKNPLSGEIEPALREVERLNNQRQEQFGDNAAPVVLLYRGGDNAKTPETWEYHYRRALDLTSGKMVGDMAHGPEQAHDPAGAFQKSVEGQKRAIGHAYAVAVKHGEMPCGIMMEASDAHSPTDPVIPHAYALGQAIAFNSFRRTLVTA